MYETDDQQLETLKKWWQENGKSIIAGVVIGLTAVFAWRAWVEYRENVAATASNSFDQLVQNVERGNLESATQQAKNLAKAFQSTPYGAFADLMQARVRFEQKDLAGTKAALEQALTKASDPALRSIAVLRLARILLAEGNADGASKALQDHPAPPAFAGEYAALRGDIALAKGDPKGARAAYEQAILGQVGNPEQIQLKLDNLPPAS